MEASTTSRRLLTCSECSLTILRRQSPARAPCSSHLSARRRASQRTQANTPGRERETACSNLEGSHRQHNTNNPPTTKRSRALPIPRRSSVPTHYSSCTARTHRSNSKISRQKPQDKNPQNKTSRRDPRRNLHPEETTDSYRYIP